MSDTFYPFRQSLLVLPTLLLCACVNLDRPRADDGDSGPRPDAASADGAGAGVGGGGTGGAVEDAGGAIEAAPSLSLDGGIDGPSTTPPDLCPAHFEFEDGLHGATPSCVECQLTLSRATETSGCGLGSLRASVSGLVKMNSRAFVHLPLMRKPIDLEGKTLTCLFRRSLGSDPFAQVWLELFANDNTWIEAWQIRAEGWQRGRPKLVDMSVVASSLKLLITSNSTKAEGWTGDVFVDSCGWE